MNFQRTNTKISLLEDYYNHFDEEGRLDTRHGQVEFATAIKYISDVLNNDKSYVTESSDTSVESTFRFIFISTESDSSTERSFE